MRLNEDSLGEREQVQAFICAEPFEPEAMRQDLGIAAASVRMRQRVSAQQAADAQQAFPPA